MLPCLLIRADASPEIGTGHIMRSLALSQEWMRRGGKAHMLCKQLPGALGQRLRREGVGVEMATAGIGSFEDAVHTQKTALDLGAEWVLADGYAFGLEYQKCIREGEVKLLMLDDYAHLAEYDVDILLNQNISAQRRAYEHVRSIDRLLLGPAYVLLRDEFVGRGQPVRSPGVDALQVLVSMGGADPAGTTSRVLELLDEVLPAGHTVSVLVGAANPRHEALADLAGRRPYTCRLVDHVDDMYDFMQSADLVIGAAGSSAYEYLFMGLPAIVGTYADNQVAIADALGEKECCENIGSYVSVEPQRLAETIGRLCADQERRAAMVSRGQALIDGLGRGRVVDAMLESAA